MWVFGYGSLMWDGWQQKYDCISSRKADLIGYHCKFNKASVRNWGTKKSPGPTLNIEKHTDSICQGLLFEFPDNKKEVILNYLQKREGKAFTLKKNYSSA
ncbi:MAG: hypothetical protein DHS20C17_05320 [Cyclobacteriaceae bacterium]|nr:MAG: hypothetical protein DHS20C17_05320 [Cyclobacteriaceae bacterium]